MRRAEETARILAKGCRTKQVSRAYLLRECLPTRPKTLSLDVSEEMIRRGKDRADRAFRRYFRPPSGRDVCDVLVCHGNLIRYLVCRALNLDGFPWWSLGTFHCGITFIRIATSGEVILDSYNDTGHIPIKLRTSGARQNS